MKLWYPELPEQIQIVRGGNYTFTLSATYTSYGDDVPYTKLYVKPQYRDPYQIQSNTADRLRDLLTYEPMGSLTLNPGERVYITATIRAPDNADLVFVFPRWALDGLGLGTDATLILSDLES